MQIQHRHGTKDVRSKDLAERDDDAQLGVDIEHGVDLIADGKSHGLGRRLHRRRRRGRACGPVPVVGGRHDERDVVSSTVQAEERRDPASSGVPR